MRRCNKCGETKPLNEFCDNRTSPQGKGYMCKPCRRSYDRARYKAFPEDGRKRTAKHKQKKSAQVRDLVWDIVSKTPCADCGLVDPVVMEFDHRPGEKKLYNVASMIGNTYAVSTVEREIAKCDVVCANCHRRRTNRRSGWWRDMLDPTITKENR